MKNNGRRNTKSRPRNNYSSNKTSYKRYSGRAGYSSGSRSGYYGRSSETGYYSNSRYNYTSEAFDYDEDIRISAPRKRKKRVAFAKAREAAPLSLIKTYGTIALIFAMALVNLVAFASNSTKRDSILAMQEQVAELTEENMFLENSIEEGLDLKKIENEAVKLGLQKPAEYQIMYINVPKESYTVQYSQSDANDGIINKLWTKVQKIFEG